VKLAALGAKWSPTVPLTDQIVVPFVGLPESSVQVNATPPHSCTSMPRCFLYQAINAAGSLALKKMPPMPVTLFIAPSHCRFCGKPSDDAQSQGHGAWNCRDSMRHLRSGCDV